MVWSVETSQGFEQDKIAAHVVRYTRGKGLDLGCGQRKVWPHCIGMDDGKYGKGEADVIGDISDLSMFADKSMDFVFSSHALEDFEDDCVPILLKEWARVIKTDGYLVLYIPSANLYPKVGEPGANPLHKWNIFPGDICKHLLGATTSGWSLLENEERNQLNEYSLFEVYQKRDDGKFVAQVWERNPSGKKRALLIRYGAIGDQIMASSVLPLLKRKGYHITYNTTPSGQEIVKHDPHIDDFLIQDKDQVPNLQLGAYWGQLQERYDHIVNLCESVEGMLLTLPGRLTHAYPDESRRRLYGKRNYLEITHDIADVPYEFRPKFYPTDSERALAKFSRNQMNGPVICWAINGSSPHKVYPWTQVVTGWLMEKTPAHVVLLSDEGVGKQLREGILECLKKDGIDTKRVHSPSWSIRDVLAFCQIADCVVGPETGPLNAVAFERNAKVIYLSHSSHENLTRDWVNTRVLIPEQATAPCFPCHRLHFTWEHCHQDEKTSAALCASAVSPERVFTAIAAALGARKAA